MENPNSNLPVAAQTTGMVPVNRVIEARKQEVLAARKATLFIDFTLDDKMVSLESIIKTAYLDAGISIPGNTQAERSEHIKALSMRVIVIVQERYPAITGSEIRLACRGGATGAYGDFYGVSPRTIVSWIQEYMTQRGAIILSDTPQLPPPSLPKPTEEEWMGMMIQKLRKSFSLVSQGQDPVDYGNVLFRFLREKGMIPLSKDDIDSYVEQARTLIIAENDPSDARSLGDRIDRRNLINSIMTEQTQQEAVMIRARSIALREYLMLIDDIDSEVEKIKNAF